ncbi:MAG TPA: hypothetical protein VFK68_10530 [Propionibacteriaceae bacterium]|nr:hypothetical protein [Propionibacteriaceae bacterium]
MAIVVLASASGSPGVTTTALGVALVWHRPVVLVDADPVGGSALLAGYFQGTVIDDDAMVALVLAQRDTRLAEVLPSTLIPVPDSHVSILPGPKSHVQAGSLAELWGPLACELAVLEQTGQDVIVDAGRLGMVHSPDALLRAADLAVLVTRSPLPALAAARQWATAWSAASKDGTGPASAAALVVGPGRPYESSEVEKVLELPVLESVAWEPRSAAVLSEGQKPPRASWPQRDELVRSYRAVAAALQQRVAAQRLAASSGDVW